MTIPSADIDSAFLDRLRSPSNASKLNWVAPYILDDGENLWPYFDGIPFLRLQRDELRNRAIDLIKQGKPEEALACLLCDRRDSKIPPADEKLALLVASQSTTINTAMVHLEYGPMATYISHRFCLPTYLSGLSLLENHTWQGASLIEIGCGTGHFLFRWLQDTGNTAIGCDLVFSYLWLAKKFVASNANFLCADVNFGIPLSDDIADIAFCHDAYHYLESKEAVFAEMNRLSTHNFTLIGHAHNKAQDNFSPGFPLLKEEYIDALRPTCIYDDADLTNAALTGKAPKTTCQSQSTDNPQAFAFVCGKQPYSANQTISFPALQNKPIPNPILNPSQPFPMNEKLKAEFVDQWDYLRDINIPNDWRQETIANRNKLLRQRVLLETPVGWLDKNEKIRDGYA